MGRGSGGVARTSGVQGALGVGTHENLGASALVQRGETEGPSAVPCPLLTQHRQEEARKMSRTGSWLRAPCVGVRYTWKSRRLQISREGPSGMERPQPGRTL